MRLIVLAVLVLALVTLFAVYSVVYTQSLQPKSQSTVTLATYSLRGSYNYVATLKPNDVYNSTTLSLGQGALFVSITKLINVTYTCTVFLSQPGDVDLNASYLVTLSGGAWNKTLASGSQSNQQTGTTSAIASRSFLLNMTRILTLEKEIEAELQTPSPTHLVQIKPTITGSITESGRVVPVYFVTPLNLTQSNGAIIPGGASYYNQGNITSMTEVTNGSVYNYRYSSYIFLSVSILLLGICVFYVLRIEKKAEPAEVDSIEKMIRPYAEVIATTTSLPKGESQVVMEKWEDLVKVADTLGKPILEFLDRGEGFTHHVFWVVDTDTTYLFESTTKQKWVP